MGSRCCCPKKGSNLLQPDYDPNPKPEQGREVKVTAVSGWDDPQRIIGTIQDVKVSRDADATSSDYQPLTGTKYTTSGHQWQQSPVSNVFRVSQDSGSTVSCLQHIADREPEDVETDPSLNPLKKTLFMKRCELDVDTNLRKKFLHQQQKVGRSTPAVNIPLRRCNSSSTLFIDNSTITRPDKKSTVYALSNAIYLQIKNRDRPPKQSLPPIFDERLHPIQKAPLPKDYRYQVPTHQNIYQFVHNIFDVAQLNAECAIVTLVYIERLLTSTETELAPVTWRRAVLCAILLASKVWDDQAVWNVDYCQILKDLRVNDVNDLERQFLEIIQFNINVPSSVYAKYYFDIRSLHGENLQKCQLSLDRAAELEAYSRVANSSFRKKLLQLHKPPLWGSLDQLTKHVKASNAVLS